MVAMQGSGSFGIDPWHLNGTEYHRDRMSSTKSHFNAIDIFLFGSNKLEWCFKLDPDHEYEHVLGDIFGDFKPCFNDIFCCSMML